MLTQRKINAANKMAGIKNMPSTISAVWRAVRGNSYCPESVLRDMTARQLCALLQVQMHAYMAGQDSRK